ncbi:MAG: class I SAM-dependent methyltransferase [Stellaceae bacterium]
MDRFTLTSKEYWSAVNEPATNAPPRAPSSLKRLVRAMVGRERLDRLTASYSEELYWRIVTRTVAPSPGKRSLEIGSAPGHNSVLLTRKLLCEPFGVEYTEVGARVNRRVFADAGINPANVFENDIFDDEFLNKHREEFDIVMSGGFIEHFSEPRGVIERHIALLKDGGVLLIGIPRLRGLGYVLTKIIAPNLLSAHNIRIMSFCCFKELFVNTSVEPLFCGLVGGIGLEMITSNSKRYWIRSAGSTAQKLLNVALRVLPFKVEGELISPHLLFVGVKHAQATSAAPG